MSRQHGLGECPTFFSILCDFTAVALSPLDKMNPYEPPKSESSAITFMDGASHRVTCAHCDEIFSGTPKKTFLGFQQYTCPACREKFKYPLTRGYRIIYWVLLIGACGVIVTNPGSQPNLFTLLMGIAVIWDLYLIWKRQSH